MSRETVPVGRQLSRPEMPKSTFTDAYGIMLRNLVALRKARGMSQVALAKAVGKEQTFISRVERGERRLDVVEFYAWSKALNADPASAFVDLIEGFPERVEI